MDDETQKTYDALGTQYLDAIRDDSPSEIDEFIAEVPEGGRVLDVGCAGGRDSAIFASRGFEVIGIDLSKAFLAEAKKLVPGATFFKMDLRELTFPEEHFDAVWTNAVLLHLKKSEAPKALAMLLFVLKRGGIIHVRVKEGTGEKYVTDELSQGRRRFFSFYEPGELEKMMGDIGFAVDPPRVFGDEIGREGVRWISIWAKK